MMRSWQSSLGAVAGGDGACRFRVWAPQARTVEVHLLSPRDRLIPLQPQPRGYHEAIVGDVAPGTLYRYRLDGKDERPDPASRSQPQGVHGPSQVVARNFAWTDTHWFGPPLADYVLYELHVGTFTPEGTFDAIIPRLDALVELGVTAVELMPLAEFPGSRNWGYDGVYLFAPQSSYGGPEGLKRLVDACHRRGLAVVLDVVYNHLGPEGNYLWSYGPYFTDRYKTPWGPALNFDGQDSDEVRTFFLENALAWQTEYHIDALRLDAIHAIRDHSARPFLQELKEATARQAERLNRRFYLIAESSLNDAKVVRPPEVGGLGLDAQWTDDFHHVLRVLLTGERQGYYADFGGVGQLAKSFREGYVFTGQYSAYRGRRHGNSAADRPAQQFVVFSQNHDQVGNRMLGERLTTLVSFESLKLAAATVLLSPFVPLLFMGEEYGEAAPFLFFTSHGDPQLIEGVRKGRRQEFASFRWQGEPPDPQDEATFRRCVLRPEKHTEEKHRVLRAFYRELLHLRKTVPALAHFSKEHQEVVAYEKENVLCVRRWRDGDEVCLMLHFGETPVEISSPVPSGELALLLDSADPRWLGHSKPPATPSGALALEPKAALLYHRGPNPT